MKKKEREILEDGVSVISIENAIKGFELIKEWDKGLQREEDELYRKYRCRKWLIVPELMYEEVLKDKKIKKRDIEKDSCSAYIQTIENNGAFQWVRLYKRKLSKLNK
jgi:hypothetical protein